MENTKDKPIGCICHTLDKENSKCLICEKIDLPGYELVRINLSPSRIIPGQNHLAPILLPQPIPVPEEVRELLKDVGCKGCKPSKNGIQNNQVNQISTNSNKSLFTCKYGNSEDTTNKAYCQSCGNTKTQLKVFECKLESIVSCTVDRKVEGIQCCKDCNFYKSK